MRDLRPEPSKDLYGTAGEIYRANGSITDPPAASAFMLATAMQVERDRCLSIVKVYLDTPEEGGENGAIVTKAMRETAKAIHAFISAGSTIGSETP